MLASSCSLCASSRIEQPLCGPYTWVYVGAASVTVEVEVMSVVVVVEIVVPAWTVWLTVAWPAMRIVVVDAEPAAPCDTPLVAAPVTVLTRVVVGIEKPAHEHACGIA